MTNKSSFYKIFCIRVEKEAEHFPTLREMRDKLDFSVHLKDRTVVEGGSVKLICAAIGKKPEMSWYRGMEQISFTPRIKDLGEPKDSFCCIHIKRAIKEDAGVYTCYAKNAKEKISTSCTLTVVPKVEIHKNDESLAPIFVRHIKGMTLCMSC